MGRLGLRLPHGGMRRAKLFAAPYSPGGGLPAGASFARALEGAQTANDGTLSFVGPNVLRESHYINGVRTLLIEGPATNLFVANLSDATWLAFGQSVDTPNFRAGVDGVANARKIVGSNADAQIYRTPTLAVDNYALSYYALSLAAGNSMRVGMYGNPNTNDYSSTAYPNAFALSATNWRRLVWARNAPTGLTQLGTRARGGGFTSPECYVCGYQTEVGLYATSLIRTATTRPADALSFPADGTLYEKYIDYTGSTVETVRAYVAGSSIAPAARQSPRGYLSIKLGLGTYTLAEMKVAL